jgi:dTMP kinase
MSGASASSGRPAVPVPGQARGRFITLEGPDGSGKTSQAARLRDRLAQAGIPVRLVREPGGTTAGERIRAILLDATEASARLDARTDALLFCAARAQNVAEVIEPALARGETVVAARYADSTLAYQGYGSGLPLDELRVLERFAIRDTRPDLTVILDLPVEVGLGRKSPGETTRFEARFDVAHHRRVREGFLALAAAEPGRFAIVDATLAEDETLAAIVAAVADRLPDLGERLRR